MTSKNTCRSCRFFDGDVQARGLAICRQRPPERSGWPLVKPDDVCGAFRPRCDAPGEGSLEELVDALEAGRLVDFRSVFAALRDARDEHHEQGTRLDALANRAYIAGSSIIDSKISSIEDRVRPLIEETE